MSSSAGGGGGSSGGGGDSFASARAAMTSDAAYSAPSTPSAPPGGGATSLGSGRDYSPPTVVSTPSAAPPSKPSTSTYTGGDGGGDRIQRIASGTEPGYRPQDEQPFGLSKEEAFRQGRITQDQYEAPVVLESQVVDERSPFQVGFENTIESVIDFYKQGGILGAVARGFSPISEAIQQKAMTFSLNRKIDSLMGELDLSNPNSMNNPELLDLQKDLSGVQAGTFKQSDYTKKYGSGDVTNPLDASFNPAALSGSERQELQNLFTPELTYAVSGQTPQESVAQQFFNNMNMTQGSPLSSDLQTDYNNAKNNINSLLGITPPSQQFGYSADPYGGLMASNLTTNPYNIDYLRRLGLI